MRSIISSSRSIRIGWRPLYRGEQLIGVFDLDSPLLDRFDADDQHGLEAIATAYLDSLEK
jgi:GAF domain-containing protein